MVLGPSLRYAIEDVSDDNSRESDSGAFRVGVVDSTMQVSAAPSNFERVCVSLPDTVRMPARPS